MSMLLWMVPGQTENRKLMDLSVRADSLTMGEGICLPTLVSALPHGQNPWLSFLKIQEHRGFFFSFLGQ